MKCHLGEVLAGAGFNLKITLNKYIKKIGQNWLLLEKSVEFGTVSVVEGGLVVILTK